MSGSALFESLSCSPRTRSPAAPRSAGLWRDNKLPVLAVAVLSPLAYVLVLFALRLAPVSLVAPARELSIVIGSIGAWLLLREPNPARRLSGAVIVLAGVAAIAAG